MSERVERYRAAYASRDVEALAALRHPDFQCYYPQSGERFLSHADWAEAHRGYADHFHDAEDVAGAHVKGGARKAEVTTTVTPFFMAGAPMVQVSDTGDLVVLEGQGTWPDGKLYKWVWIIEYRDHLVWRQTEYYTEPFEAPEWRAPFVTVDPSARG